MKKNDNESKATSASVTPSSAAATCKDRRVTRSKAGTPSMSVDQPAAVPVQIIPIVEEAAHETPIQPKSLKRTKSESTRTPSPKVCDKQIFRVSFHDTFPIVL